MTTSLPYRIAAMCMDLSRRHFLLAAGAVAIAGCSRSSEAKGMTYRVQPGDSLSTLAKRSGLPIATIVAANDLRSRHLQPGQKIHLPGITEFPPQKPAAAKEIIAPATSLALISRSQWGAKALRSNYDPMGTINKLTLHHTSEIPGMMERNDRDVVVAIQRYHQQHRNWADIGYHFLVGRDGAVYEGRPVHIQGAHVGGERNRHNLGISVVGDFQRELPNKRQLASVEKLIEEQRRRHKIPASQVLGHREQGVTVCPGDHLFSWLIGYRKRRA